MCSMPSKCPSCGSDKLMKEYHLGAQTGDWICADCKNTGWLGDDPDVSWKRVSICVAGKEVNVIKAEVANKPNADGNYGFLAKEDMGMYETSNPVPIKFDTDKCEFVAHIG